MNVYRSIYILNVNKFYSYYFQSLILEVSSKKAEDRIKVVFLNPFFKLMYFTNFIFVRIVQDRYLSITHYYCKVFRNYSIKII